MKEIKKEMISIIVPYYNGEAFIEETIESCFNQTYRNIEVIVVDDNSPNPFPNYLLQKYPQIKLIRNNINCGFCKSSNIGVRASCGEYILVLGQDDILLPEHIKKMMTSFLGENVVAVYCGYHLIDENGNDYKTCKNNDECELNMIDMTKHAIHTCGLIMKRNPFITVNGYPEEYGNYGEWELWIKLLTKGRIVFNAQTYALYRRHKNNITYSFTNYETYIQVYKYHKHCKLLAVSLYSGNCLRKGILYFQTYIWCLKRKIIIILRKMGIYK